MWKNPIFKGTDAKDFISLIDAFSVTYEQRTISEVLSDILDRSGYEEMLRTTGNQERLDNLAELNKLFMIMKYLVARSSAT